MPEPSAVQLASVKDAAVATEDKPSARARMETRSVNALLSHRSILASEFMIPLSQIPGRLSCQATPAKSRRVYPYILSDLEQPLYSTFSEHLCRARFPGSLAVENRSGLSHSSRPLQGDS